MRLLIDCTPLAVGGGLQVAIGFLTNIINDDGDFEWLAILPTSISSQLPEYLRSDSRIIFLQKGGLFNLFVLNHKIRHIEKHFNPNIVFSVFGPAYFKSKVPHIIGFALPTLIYSWPNSIKKQTLFQAIKDKYRRLVVQRYDYYIVETKVVKERLVKYLNIDKNKIEVIGNAVNPVLQALPRKMVKDLSKIRILYP